MSKYGVKYEIFYKIIHICPVKMNKILINFFQFVIIAYMENKIMYHFVVIL